MPILSQFGQRISEALHTAIYSMPTPEDHHESGMTANSMSGGTSLSDLIEEPGEPKALAGGIGPLSFAGSGYGIMLVLTAILLNRIHSIVRRPRIPEQPLPHPPHSRYQRARLRLAKFLIHPDTPRYLRLPGLFCLIRAWLLFTVVILQVANVWPTDERSPWLRNTIHGRLFNRCGRWAGEMEMGKACWQVFLSVCAGLVCGGLANGLDRARRRDVGAGFNLFGYSFLLHLYSSPLTHHRPPPAANYGRPDIHALFQMWLSLTELTWLQAIELSRTMRRNQIVPTGVCGVLGLTHFVYALSTSPFRVPSFTFLTHLLALFLLVIITFTLFLRGITFLFTYGYIPSPVWSNLLPHEGVSPSIEDDFGVALLKLGTACLEASQYSGLRNELVGIEERSGPYLSLTTDGSDVKKPLAKIGGFNAEITDIQVSQLEQPNSRTAYYTGLNSFWKAFGNSLVGLGWMVLMSTPIGRKAVKLAHDSWKRRWWYGPRQWTFWRRAAWAAPEQYRRPVLTMRQIWEAHVLAVRAAHNETPVATGGLRRRRPATRAQDEDDSRGRLYSMSPTPTRATSAYDDFLRGEVGSDDEDEQEDWNDEDADSDGTVTVMADDEEMPEHEPELYRDLMLGSAEPSFELQPVLLAHLTSSSSSPLTRRQYASILSTATSSRSMVPSRMEEVVNERRLAMAGRTSDEWDEDRRKSCIVCMTEPRDTILWPCRCLALCTDCRESLAGRLSPAEHMCPCCRKKVEGFSRIWIP